MRHWVIDTNVVVSGLLSPSGPPAQILDAIMDGRIRLVYDARIIAEYRDVLARPRLKIQPAKQREFLTALHTQLLVTPARRSRAGPDPDDFIFIEAALTTTEKTIVTGNLADYPVETADGVRILTPTQAVGELRR
jgi:putative PIN family toxin of toxin-antitoxin system